MKKINFIFKLINEEKIKIRNPNENVSNAYIIKSENSIKAAKVLHLQNLFEESISMSYYSMFHITLALLHRIGIKCENHNASIILLKELFNLDNSQISYAKEERIDKQYYIDEELTKDDSQKLIEISEEFNSQIYNFIMNLTNQQIKNFHNKFKDTYFENNSLNFSTDDIIEIRAKPNSSKSILEWDNDNKKINAYLHSIPDDNKANNELIKLFKKQLKLKIEIISGLKSRDKKVKVL